MQWSETIEGNNGYSLAKTTDNGTALAGYIATCRSCPSKELLVKLDSNGSLKWAETIGGSLNDTAYSVIQTTDKGYAVAGVTTSFGSGGNDVYIVKLDSVGNIKWTKTIGGTGNDEAYSIIQTTDKGFALAGTTTSFGVGGNDAYIIKLDSVGNTKWTRTLGGTGDDVAKSISQTTDGGYIIAGSSTSSGVGNNSPYFIKLDQLGNLEWSKAILGGTASANSIIQTKHGIYTATGITAYFGAGENDVYIFMLDTNGNTCVPYDSTLGITSIDSGRVNSGGTANSYTPIVSINTSASDTAGFITNACSKIGPTSLNTILPDNTNLQVFPNPATANITLHYSIIGSTPINVSVFDIAGNKVGSFMFAYKVDSNYTLLTSTLAPGMYIIQVTDNSAKLYSKFIKE